MISPVCGFRAAYSEGVIGWNEPRKHGFEYNGKRRSSRSDSYNQILINLQHRRHCGATNAWTHRVALAGSVPVLWHAVGSRAELLRSLAGMDGCQGQHSILLITLLSARDVGGCRPELLFDVAAGCPFIQQQNNALTLRHAGWRILIP